MNDFMNCCVTIGDHIATDGFDDDEDQTVRDIVGIPRQLPNVYQDFLGDSTNNYWRIHIYLHAAHISRSSHKRIFDRVADPYVTVETQGPDTGSTDYFPIGMQRFPGLKDTETPVWDAKGLVLAKKSGTRALKFALLDSNRGGKDGVLMEFLLPVEDLPDVCSRESLGEPGAFTKFVRHHEDMELSFSIKVTDDWFVTPQHTQTLQGDSEELAYTEHVIRCANSSTPDDSALLQSWKLKQGDNTAAGPAEGAVLWILGRNDCFMHPHVAQSLFWGAENGKRYDLYVLNYSMNGCCRQKGWVRDAHLNSHNKYGDFNCYNDQIAQALRIIQRRGYGILLGYAHSTGGPVLLNYLMECGDDAFDGFIFNSPFLDWGFVGGDLVELVLKSVGLIQKIGLLANDEKLGVSKTPNSLKDKPVRYLGQEIVLSAWSAKLWSQYHFEFDTRPLYDVPLTGGFAKGVTTVHAKLEQRYKQKKIVTAKPFLCITSRGDDVLKAAETVSRADWIGPLRCEVELNDNGHDVFLSQDIRDTAMAIDMVKSWMKGKGFV